MADSDERFAAGRESTDSGARTDFTAYTAVVPRKPSKVNTAQTKLTPPKKIKLDLPRSLTKNSNSTFMIKTKTGTNNSITNSISTTKMSMSSAKKTGIPSNLGQKKITPLKKPANYGASKQTNVARQPAAKKPVSKLDVPVQKLKSFKTESQARMTKEPKTFKPSSVPGPKPKPTQVKPASLSKTTKSAMVNPVKSTVGPFSVRNSGSEKVSGKIQSVYLKNSVPGSKGNSEMSLSYNHTTKSHGKSSCKTEPRKSVAKSQSAPKLEHRGSLRKPGPGNRKDVMTKATSIPCLKSTTSYASKSGNSYTKSTPKSVPKSVPKPTTKTAPAVKKSTSKLGPKPDTKPAKFAPKSAAYTKSEPKLNKPSKPKLAPKTPPSDKKTERDCTPERSARSNSKPSASLDSGIAMAVARQPLEEGERETKLCTYNKLLIDLPAIALNRPAALLPTSCATVD
eukprot:sb/3464587/